MHQVGIHPLFVECDDCPFMYITLPSGRAIAYPKARVITEDYGYDYNASHVAFMDNSAGQWREVRGYGGFFTENVVQAIARDILAEAILRLEAAGFPVVMHVHDSVAIEVPKDEIKTAQVKFIELMSKVPTWAKGMPIALKAKVGYYFE
jgi:DNA polymerase